MSVVQKFDSWFEGLTRGEKKELMDHILNKQLKELSEGVYAGPSGTFVKGLFAGPSATSQGRCPMCGR